MWLLQLLVLLLPLLLLLQLPPKSLPALPGLVAGLLARAHDIEETGIGTDGPNLVVTVLVATNVEDRVVTLVAETNHDINRGILSNGQKLVLVVLVVPVLADLVIALVVENNIDIIEVRVLADLVVKILAKARRAFHDINERRLSNDVLCQILVVLTVALLAHLAVALVTDNLRGSNDIDDSSGRADGPPPFLVVIFLVPCGQVSPHNSAGLRYRCPCDSDNIFSNITAIIGPGVGREAKGPLQDAQKQGPKEGARGKGHLRKAHCNKLDLREEPNSHKRPLHLLSRRGGLGSRGSLPAEVADDFCTEQTTESQVGLPFCDGCEGWPPHVELDLRRIRDEPMPSTG
mmetsp:Transcript_54690/g.138092  ORF Transcript_54690/g.138092 Transcript_54690/m.138092 type:complete len:346 (+) Transcript_54690:417-1454(+)